MGVQMRKSSTRPISLALIALFNMEKALVQSNLDYPVLCESFIQERLV